MGLKKKFMNNVYYTVYDKNEVPSSVDLTQNVAIVDENGVVLPVRRNLNDRGPGYYRSGFVSHNGVEALFRVDPTPEEVESTYNNNTDFIDFGDSKNIVDYMVNVDRERALTQSIISNVDNEYRPNIRESDEAFMQLVKSALYEKHFDISKYKNIFGANFNNDKRSLEARSITLNKATEILTKLDVEIKITLRNRGDNIPNPMQRSVSGIINGTEAFTIDYGNPDNVDEEASTYQNNTNESTYVDIDDWDGDDE